MSVFTIMVVLLGLGPVLERRIVDMQRPYRDGTAPSRSRAARAMHAPGRMNDNPSPQITNPGATPGAVTPTGCCPPFDPATWDEREVDWHNRRFMKVHVHSLFHVPIDMKRQMERATRLIEAAGAQPAQRLMLSDERSPWSSDLYIDVQGDVPGAEMATLSGHFLTKVFDGPFNQAPRWISSMEAYVEGRGRQLEKLYLAYTTCPACAHAYGHNYVVAFAKVSEPAS